MKGIVCTKYGPPDVLQVRDLAKPAPKLDEVRIKIHATAPLSHPMVLTPATYRQLIRLSLQQSP